MGFGDEEGDTLLPGAAAKLMAATFSSFLMTGEVADEFVTVEAVVDVCELVEGTFSARFSRSRDESVERSWGDLGEDGGSTFMLANKPVSTFSFSSPVATTTGVALSEG